MQLKFTSLQFCNWDCNCR